MWVAYGRGLLLMATLIVAIGVQNAFVLRQGIKREGVFISATICFLCDVLMVCAGAMGLAALFAASQILSVVVSFGGAAFLGTYGIRSLKAAKAAKGIDLHAADTVSRSSIVTTSLALSLLNPHAIIDTIVIVGGLTARYQGGERVACVLGAVTASGIWFYGLAYGARQTAPVLSKPKVWRMIDLGIGVMMLALAVSLAGDGIKLLL